MILEQSTTEVSSGGINNTSREFSIKASPKAFAILSSSIYTDKIGAVIRELCSNAVDAHAMAGKRNVPFEVQLPTSIDPQFAVKDNGLGLSEDDVYDLYSTYFSSNKTNTNDAIGAFGLGSKSPFCYVDGFTIISRHNGTRKTYMASLGEDSCPNVVKVVEDHYIGDNGLEIYMPVKQSDISNFNQKFASIMEFFEPKPTTNITVSYTKANYIVRTEAYGIRHDNYNSVARVIQGGVAYPCSSHDVGIHRSVDMFVPIGTVEVAASREALSLTPKTIEALKLAYGKAKENFFEESKNKVDACETLMDAYRTVMELLRHPMLTGTSFDKYYGTYKNFTFDNDALTILIDEKSQLIIEKFSGSGRGSASYVMLNQAHYTAESKPWEFKFVHHFNDVNYKFILNDLPSPGRFIRRYLAGTYNNTVVLLGGADAKKTLDRFGLKYRLASELKEDWPDTKRAYVKKADRKYNVYTANGIKLTDEAPEEGSVYVLSRYSQITGYSTQDDFRFTVNAFLNYFRDDTVIYVLSKELEGGIPFNEYAKTKMQEVPDFVIQNAFTTKFENGTRSALKGWAAKTELSIPTRRLFAEIARTGNKENNEIQFLAQLFAKERAHAPSRQPWNDLEKKFPLLAQHQYNWRYGNANWFEYVVLKDKV
jgi:hypothetical protein